MVTHGETGFLYAPGDVEALTSHLRRLLSDPGLRDRFGRAARQRAERTYTSAAVGAATAAAYQRLLTLPAPARVAGLPATAS
jgi:glycosyltransferase involved in cell wall biosynthesis